MTDRKRVDKTAEQHEQEIRALLEAIPDLVFRLSKDGFFLGFIPAKGQEPALPPAEFLGKNVREVLPTELALRTIDYIKRALETGDTQTFDYQLPVALPDGDLRDYEARLVASGEDEVLAISRDITERKRAEDKLRFLSSVVEQSSEGMAVSDLEANLLFVNDAFATMHGYAAEELVGRHLSVFHTPQQMPGVEAANRQLQETGEFSGEISHVRRDGTVFPTLMHNSLLRNEAGSPIGMVGTVRDITERKRAEEALRDSEERLREVLETSRDWIYKHNLETETYDYISPAVLQITGFTPEQFTAMGFEGAQRRVHPEDLQRQMTHLVSLLGQTGEAGMVPTIRYRWKCKDGEYRWFSDNRAVIRDKDGRPVARVGTIRDITENTRAEDALHLQSEIMQHMAEAVYLIRASDGVIVYTNPAFERLFGYGPGEMVGKHVSVVNAPTDKSPEETAKEITAALDRTGAWRGEILNIKKDGTPFWCYANVSTFDHPGHGRVWVTYHTDITERKRAEEAVREYEQRSREVLEASRDMVYKLNVETRKFEYVSPAVQPLTGFTPQELVGMRFDEVTARVHPQDQPEFRTRAEELPACLGEARAGSAIEYRWQRKDGKYRWLSNSWVLLRDDNGQPAAIVGTVRDITNRKRTEEALQRAREDLETRVEARMDGGNTYGLTFRELTVLHLVATGNADKEIAVRLGIRPRTVNKHLENILHKMGADSRTEAGVRALKESLIG